MTHLQHACTAQPPDNASRWCNGVIGPICQCGTMKFAPTNISWTQRRKTAHLQHTRSTQPCGNLSRHCWEDHRARWQHGTLKIKHLNDKKLANPQTIEMTHLERASAAQPHQKALNQVHGVNRPSHQCRRPKFKWRNISQALEVEMTHLWCMWIAQPPIQHAEHPYRDVECIWQHGNASRCAYRAFGPRCGHGWIKFEPINISPVQNSKTAHLRHAHTAQPPKIPLKHCYRVHRPSCQHGWIKFKSISVSKA